ncbi:MAG: LolA family protein [Geminicoccales bacterium]
MVRWPLLPVAALLLAIAWAPARSALPDAAHEPIARVEAYLNGLDTLRSSFVQINPDGARLTGDLYYERPDKMRLEYDPPSRVLIVADRWQVIYHDRKLDQVSHLLTGSTPLGFLLDEDVSLSGDVTVTRVEEAGGELRLTLVQTDEPDQGTITLTFAEQPLQLRSWTVVDAQGLATYVILDDVETGVALDDELFVFRNPRFDPAGRD